MDSVWFDVIVGIHLMFCLVALILSVVLLAISWRTKGFHENLTAIIQFSLFMQALGSSARFISGICDIFGIVAERGFLPAMLINTTVLLKSAQTYSFCFNLASIAVERCLATYFLSDYEQRSRRTVRISLISTSFCISALLGGTSVFRDLTDIDLPYVTAIVLFSTMVISYLYWYNNRKMTQSTEWKLPYTLSFRFQLQENIRVFKMLRYVYMTAIGTTFIGLGLLFALTKCDSRRCNRLVYAMFQLEVSISGCIIVSVCAISVPQWRLELRKLLHLRGRNSIQNMVTSSTGVNMSAMYFEQLGRSWS